MTLGVVNYGECTKNQICTYAKGKDSCQSGRTLFFYKMLLPSNRIVINSDSGGPLYLYDNNKLYVVGIISYGYACATTEPAVNTKVTAYLDWIVNSTSSTSFCVL